MAKPKATKKAKKVKKEQSSERRVLMGYVGVDSGQLIVCDPCYMRSQTNLIEYDRDCDKQFEQLKYDMGSDGLGVVFNSGLGDGYYAVYGYIKKLNDWGERIVRVEIVMVDNEYLEKMNKALGHK